MNSSRVQVHPNSWIHARLPSEGPSVPKTRVWKEAAQWLASIFLYALCSILCAWLSTLCISQGFVFSGVSGPHQSRAVFLTGVLLWAHLFFCSSVLAMRAMALFPLHLLSNPNHPAGARRILMLMAKKTLPWFVLCGFMLTTVGMGIGSLSETWHQLKLEIYIGSIVYFSYVAVVDQAARRLYRRETVEGSAAARVLRASSSHVGRRRAIRHTLRVAVAKLSLLFALLGPIWYVHAISSITIVTSNASVVWIILGSLGFKALMQEAARRFVASHHVDNPRSMATLVCMPTVIVDTQVRIVFMRFQSAMASMSSTLILAGVEVALRFTKAWLLKRKISQRVALDVVSTSEKRSHNHSETFTIWREHLSRHSVMELSASMFAEYSAIGCSCAIMVIYGAHSQYSIGVSSDSVSITSNSLVMLGFQVGVEVVVDYVSCVMELLHGVDLASFDRERSFLFVFFLAITLLNINVSSTLYLAN